MTPAQRAEAAEVVIEEVLGNEPETEEDEDLDDDDEDESEDEE